MRVLSSTKRILRPEIPGGRPSTAFTSTLFFAVVLFTAAPLLEAQINHSAGFASNADLQANGTTQFAPAGTTVARLTSGVNGQAGTFFAKTPQTVCNFSTTFRFQITYPAGPQPADGMCFIIQGIGANALGPAGGGLGYGPDTNTTTPANPPDITKSICIKFDIYSNQGEGTNSTGLFLDGNAPTIPIAGSGEVLVNLVGTPINLLSQDVMQVDLTYDGTTLTQKITDTVTAGTYTTTYTVNIPAHVGGNTAFVGFGGGTGGLNATQDVISWTFTPPPPPPGPTGLMATPGPQSVSLTWNAVAGATSYNVKRGTAPGTETTIATVTMTSYTDSTVLYPNTYYYVVTANLTCVGESLPSNEVGATPLPPPPKQVHTTHNLAHRCGCSSIGDAHIFEAIGVVALLALGLVLFRRR